MWKAICEKGKWCNETLVPSWETLEGLDMRSYLHDRCGPKVRAGADDFAVSFFNLAVLGLSCGSELSAVASRIEPPDHGSNPGPLHWQWGFLATGPPGKFWVWSRMKQTHCPISWLSLVTHYLAPTFHLLSLYQSLHSFLPSHSLPIPHLNSWGS